MQRRLLKRRYIFILIILICLYSVLSFLSPVSYATTYTYTANSNDLPSDFDSLYPGYRKLIEKVVEEHPNWTIKLLNTGLNWDTVINNENTGHKSSPSNLVPSSYTGNWVCEFCGTTPYDSGSWYCASRYAVEYMMDPRNFINSNDIFQFQDLGSATADRVAIEKMVSGTFINTTECIDAVFEAANTYHISPYHLVSRIIQEQGVGGSTLSLGRTLDDGITYYNLFNIGATGNTESEVIENGFATAKSKGWSTMRLAILRWGRINSKILHCSRTKYYILSKV